MADQPHAILTASAMREADSFAVSQGVSGQVLMQAAGDAVAEVIMQGWSARPTAILCGPGNNGGDGWVIAQTLQAAGWPVSVFSMGDVLDLSGDAAWAAKAWTGPVGSLNSCQLNDFGLVVDAMFGAGLNRSLEGESARLAQDSQDFDGICVAVDTPSGLSGDMASMSGPVVHADLTVTFHRFKPAHLLSPGRALCGEIVLCDIGIPDGWSERASPCATLNHPDLWRVPGADIERDAHKHSRGRLCVLAGGRGATGAARLAARAGQIGGAGFVTVLSGQGALNEIASSSDSLVARRYDRDVGFDVVLSEHRASAIVMGPGAGVSARLKEQVRAACDLKTPLVLDADAISAFEDEPDALFAGLHADCVLTPHGGEFARLFPELTEGTHSGNKIERTREAARRCGAVVVFKGADTVIAEPGGEAWVNVHASARLATAGTGDVLAGLIGAFLAQGAPTAEAACAAVYVHGDAGRRLGPGGTADTVLARLPHALDAVSQAQKRKAALQRLNPHTV